MNLYTAFEIISCTILLCAFAALEIMSFICITKSNAADKYKKPKIIPGHNIILFFILNLHKENK